MFTTINVRGTKFDVNNDTLKRVPYFEALLSRWSSGDMVIDRCPDSFRHILDYLAYGRFRKEISDREDEFMVDKIRSDCDYFGLEVEEELPTPCKKRKSVDNVEEIKIRVGHHQGVIGVSQDIIEELDELVEKHPQYYGSEKSRSSCHHFKCCLENYIKGRKQVRRFDHRGLELKCVLNKQGGNGSSKGIILYRCSFHDTHGFY